jgi:hypothetical protein
MKSLIHLAPRSKGCRSLSALEFWISAQITFFFRIGPKSNIQWSWIRVWFIKICSQGGGSHMFKVRTLSGLALFFLVTALTSSAVPAEKATPSGKVTMSTTSIAAGVGVSWGDGTLTVKGKNYPFSIEGLSLVNWGISKAQANGDVYNLTDVSKFAGTYVAAEAGLTLAGGMGGMVLRNSDGVVLHLRSVSQGAQLQLGTSGLIIKMK